MYNEYAIKYGLCKRKYKYYVSAPETEQLLRTLLVTLLL